MDSRARDVLKIGDKAFSDKQSVDAINQELALNFAPHLADFTSQRDAGDDYASHLFSSFPVVACRELTNIFASDLRPRSQKWFSVHVEDKEIDEGEEERAYLERMTDVQWRATYDGGAGFIRATKQADEFFALTGNAVIKVGKNIAGDGLLYTNYHIRDNAWSENAEGKIDCNHRNWNPTARQLKHHFPGTISRDVEKAGEKEPEKQFECRHVVMPSRLYDYKSKSGKRFPFVSLYIERGTETVLEEIGLNYFCYVIPRWQTISGSPYGRSMATSVILPDGRTMQVVTRVLREAGEKYVDPPMVAITDAIRGDIALYPGGVTTADIEYDERLGEVLRPITQDRSGFPIGDAIAAALRQDINSGFFLDKIRLPDTTGDMTAYQVRKIIEQTVRAQSPIFEPIEQEYNTPLCETTFQVLFDGGAFGPMNDMPERLRGQDIQFSFRSPLADMAEQNDAEIYKQVRDEIILPAAQIDPAQLENIDWTEATRDAVRAAGFKAKWMKPKEAVQARQEEMQRAATLAKGMEAVGNAGAAAEQGARGLQALTETGV